MSIHETILSTPIAPIAPIAPTASSFTDLYPVDGSIYLGFGVQWIIAIARGLLQNNNSYILK